jgi:hypothetical protein
MNTRKCPTRADIAATPAQRAHGIAASAGAYLAPTTRVAQTVANDPAATVRPIAPVWTPKTPDPFHAERTDAAMRADALALLSELSRDDARADADARDARISTLARIVRADWR